MKILIVDSSPSSVLKDIVPLAEAAGHQILTPASRAEVFTVFERERPDAVMLAAVLPDMDAAHLASTLRILSADDWVPIVFLCDTTSDELVVQGMRAGVDDFLMKPVRPAVLEAKLQFLERSSQQRRRLRAKESELETLASELKRMTRCDGLTGIANRRHFDTELVKEWRRACRSGNALSLCLIDLDNFGAFNELYGHLDGDDCLQRTAQALLTTMRRAGDLVARYDGDCFAVLMPDTDADILELCAERLQAAVHELGIPHAGAKNGQITASVGVACLGPAATKRADDLLRAAEAALLRSREAPVGKVAEAMMA